MGSVYLEWQEEVWATQVSQVSNFLVFGLFLYGIYFQTAFLGCFEFFSVKCCFFPVMCFCAGACLVRCCCLLAGGALKCGLN